MLQQDNTTHSAAQKKRKYRRFGLRFPVHVKFRSGELVSEIDAVSSNVSIGGLLMQTTSEIPRHSPVSFSMTVQGGTVISPILLAGEGEVVRVEPSGPGAGFAIALACKHPIAQISYRAHQHGTHGRA